MKTDEEILAEMEAKDSELAKEARRLAQEEADGRFGRKAAKRRFFLDDFPLHITHAVVGAKAFVALPLVEAAHRNMRMRTIVGMAPVNEALLTQGVWEAAKFPSVDDWSRRTALLQLQRIPEVMAIEERRSPIARYLLRRGPLWKEKPLLRIRGETYWLE
jgi:hypothetical protein